jgi:type II secretory pathway component PulJ
MKKHQGFTLAELLVYIGLFAIILTILTEILVSLLKVQLESESISNLDQDSRYIITRLNYDLNRASSITGATTGNTLYIIVSGATYKYSQFGNNLFLTVNSQPSVMLNSFDTSVSNLNFQRLGTSGDSIGVGLTLTSQVIQGGNRHEIKSINTVIGLRPNL